MPELCRFYNIIIKMIYSDNGQHNKPHFHVYFAEYEASVGVDGELLAGSLPVKQLKLVQAKMVLHMPGKPLPPSVCAASGRLMGINSGCVSTQARRRSSIFRPCFLSQRLPL